MKKLYYHPLIEPLEVLLEETSLSIRYSKMPLSILNAFSAIIAYYPCKIVNFYDWKSLLTSLSHLSIFMWKSFYSASLFSL